LAHRPRLEPLEERQLLAVDLVSIGLSGISGDNTSDSACISADGRYVAFESIASDLVEGDTGHTDVFVRDLVAGTTTRVSTDSNGTQANGYSEAPSISGDGRYVAFYSDAVNLVAGDTNAYDDIFVKDLFTGATTLVSVDSSGSQADYNCMSPSISSNGRYVAFQSRATNLVANDTNGTWDIFVKDLVSGEVALASSDSDDDQADSYSYDTAVSGDGRYVAFRSNATNLVADDTNGVFDVFVKDLVSGVTTRVSTDSDGNQADDLSDDARLTSDGRYVSFYSIASNLVTNDTNNGGDCFVKDMWTGVTTRVDTDSDGGQAVAGASPSLSADGRYVAFVSGALVSDDTNQASDIFVKDLVSGITLRANLNNYGGQTNYGSGSPQISADGRYITFLSDATNLNAADTTDLSDVYRVWNPFLTPEITLYGSTVAENLAAGTVVGAFSTGANPSGTFSYSLVAGDGDSDNAAFTIDGQTLKTAATCDYETQTSYTIRVQANDGAGVTCEQTFTVTVADVHDNATIALYDSATSTFMLRTSNTSGTADYTFAYGAAGAGWTTLVGDWDGDGTSGVGLFDATTSTFYLTSAYTDGYAEYTFGYGVPQGGWTALVGDWDGNGSTGVGLYDPSTSTFYLTNTLATGTAEQTFGYGVPQGGWTPLVGDWDGDGSSGVGLFAPDTSTFYLTNAFVTGVAQYTFGYGVSNAGWTALVGDWDGNGSSGVGLYDPTNSLFYLTNTLETGTAEYTVEFGTPSPTLKPLVGCWATSTAAAVDQLDLAALASSALHPNLLDAA
jgi:Tol biopolymer transport system component